MVPNITEPARGPRTFHPYLTSYYSNLPDPHGSSEPVLYPVVSSGDFSKVVVLKARRKVTDHKKLFLLTKDFIPPHNYKFPACFVSGHNRHFQQSWLDQHNGLVYSESENGGYCKYCALFSQDGAWCCQHAVDWLQKASEKLFNHFHHKQFHQASLETAATFTSVMKNPDLAVSWSPATFRKKCAAENHLLISIAKTVIFWWTAGTWI